MTKVVNLSEFSGELGDWAKQYFEEARLVVLRALIDAIPELVESSPVDTGLYAQSWDAQPTEQGAVIGNYAPHAPILEYGARPFTPPLAPLLAWAKRVLEDPSQPPNYSDAVQGLARYTQKKIAREGIAPRHIMERAIPGILQRIEDEMRRTFG